MDTNPYYPLLSLRLPRVKYSGKFIIVKNKLLLNKYVLFLQSFNI